MNASGRTRVSRAGKGGWQIRERGINIEVMPELCRHHSNEPHLDREPGKRSLPHSAIVIPPVMHLFGVEIAGAPE